MSAILSADDLNDFISPGVACIKPIETIPKRSTQDEQNPYEVTTEEQLAATNPAPAQISLTDCLACSGCVTSAEAVLVSLQSHLEVLNTLDAYPSLRPEWAEHAGHGELHRRVNGFENGANGVGREGKIFVASVSPQTRASLAALYGVSQAEAGNIIAQLLSGPEGLAAGGNNGSSFLWVIDTNRLREVALVLAADEVAASLADPVAAATDDGSGQPSPMKPILTSACPGWICYAEKTHPHILPHLSRLKSPQALTGTLLKSVLSKRFGIPPSQVWHLAIMPCFDKKLEASRSELTSAAWSGSDLEDSTRDVDCVITARELITLAAARGIDLASLPRRPLSRKHRTPFPDPIIDRFLFPPARRKAAGLCAAAAATNGEPSAGTSGGFLWHILQTQRAQHPGSTIQISRGRNADVLEYALVRAEPSSSVADGQCPRAAATTTTLFKAARYYGFRNIQNLVRRLKPPRTNPRLLSAARSAGARKLPGARDSAAPVPQYDYVEVMACPGGCTNGGGQIRADEVGLLLRGQQETSAQQPKLAPQQQRDWLARVDEAYFSASSSSSNSSSDDDIDDGDDSKDEAEHSRRRTNGTTAATDNTTSPLAWGPDGNEAVIDGVSHTAIHAVVDRWAQLVGVAKDALVYTSYRSVESEVGRSKARVSDEQRVAELAARGGGGW